MFISVDMRKKNILLLALVALAQVALCQNNNSIDSADTLTQTQIASIYLAGDSAAKVSATKTSPEQYRISYRQFIIPTLLIGTGFIGLKSDWLLYQNHEIRDELQENKKSNFPIDNYTQFAPIAAVYGLNLCGIKGRHNFRDRTLVLTAAALMMTTTVKCLKSITNVRRPDGGKYSFPSGHTATAFMSAEFLWHEYHDVSPWIGFAGYAIATGTGFLRLYNNQHWLTDVLAGAGIGILSTKTAYWLLPCMRKLFSSKSRISAIAVPQVGVREVGLGCALQF